MAIALRCPGCGKHYQLPGKLAGKQVKCKCGRTTQVPVPAKNTPQTPDDIRLIEEPAQAAAVPAPTGPVPNAAAAPASGETLGPVPEETSPPAPEQTLFRRLKAKWLERVPMRTLVGVLSVGYGSLLAALALRPIIMAPLWASWLVALVNLVAIALPALMAVGGVLILRRHEHGPICAGLASLALCLVGVLGLIWVGLLTAPAVNPLGFLLAGLYTLVYYAIPAAVAYWCLREEIAQHGDPDEHC